MADWSSAAARILAVNAILNAPATNQITRDLGALRIDRTDNILLFICSFVIATLLCSRPTPWTNRLSFRFLELELTKHKSPDESGENNSGKQGGLKRFHVMPTSLQTAVAVCCGFVLIPLTCGYDRSISL